MSQIDLPKNLDTENVPFQNALRLVQYTHQSIFLTGKAGTGKSTFLKYVCQHTKKKFVVLAPTGIAAINVGGTTLHSFFKLPFYPLLPDDSRFATTRRLKDFLKYNKERCQLLNELELIIIDEISMVRADIIDFIDKILRVYSGNRRTPFGGKQLLLVGDIYQLEPVVKAEEKEMISRFYPTQYFFSANAFKEMELVSIELTKVYRQKDIAFVTLLDRIRNNTAGSAELQLLNTRYQSAPLITDEDENTMSITLATRRDTVDFINQQHLDDLEGEAVTMKGSIEGEFPDSSLPTLMELVIKNGAQVMMLKNDMNHRYVNGTLGRIEHIDENGQYLHIMTEDGVDVNVEREKWSNMRYTYNETEKKIEEEEIGVFTQFPIRLAWAITIHKSQGLTFKRAIIDFTGGTFASGQAYVALSRCTSLNGIELKKPVMKSDIYIKPLLVQYAQHFNNQAAINRAMNQAQADISYEECIKSFDQGNYEAFMQHFIKAIHLRYDIEKPLYQRFIRHKLGVINQLKDENQMLRERYNKQQNQLKKYAQEYLKMGDDCILNGRHVKAALANYDKALEMNPCYTEAYIRKGITLQDDNKLHEATACFNKAVELSPTMFKAVYNLGKNLLLRGYYDESVTLLFKAVALNKEHAHTHDLLGTALSHIGKEEEAAIQWEIAEQLRKKPRKKKK